MMPPLIALDATLVGSEKTGDAVYWTCLIEALTERGSDFGFLLLSNAKQPADVPSLPPNFRWVHIPCRPTRWQSLVTLPLKARRLGAVAFHTQYNLSPLARRGITTIHDVSFFVGPEWFRPRDRAILQRFVPSSARRAKKVITVSESSKRDILRYIPIQPSQVAVTPLAAHRRFQPQPEADCREVLGDLRIVEPYLLSVGTQWPRKNFSLAYEAVRMLPQELPHRLVVTGRFDWGDAPQSERVSLTGYLDSARLPAVYSRANLYLCPSHYEGFGIPILEAMACGAPVLTSAGGSLREVAADAAVVMADMTPSAWTAKIVELLGDSSILDDLRRRGFERARQFTWSETARRTLEVYREVAR